MVAVLRTATCAPLVFLTFLVIRVLSALYSPIADCDEVYNYWEPLHFVLFGSGLQTWEYAPQFALRSYSFIWLHAQLIQILHFLLSFVVGPFSLHSSSFWLLRLCFATFSAIAETAFVTACRAAFSEHLAFSVWVFSAFAAGNFHASISFLPQSFVLLWYLFAFSAWLWTSHGSKFAPAGVIICMGVAGLIGWPFAVILAVPMGVSLVYHSGITRVAILGLAVAVCLVAFSIAIDLHFYRRLLFPPLNIVAYNWVDSSGAGGADLYGTEPFSFYSKNLILNFNIAYVLFLVFPICLFLHKITHSASKMFVEPGFYARMALFSSPGYLWLLVFQSMSHKEERFLYVIYPALSFASASCLELLRRSSVRRRPFRFVRDALYWALPILFIACSLSRTSSLVSNFSAPVQVYSHLSQHVDSNVGSEIVVCVGKEWYRFPSSFFLPPHSRVAFVESGFHGQLPKPFLNTWGEVPDLNDRNMEVLSRYTPKNNCDFFIDWNVQPSESWEEVFSTPFLDSEASPFPFRSFHIPYLSSKYNDYKMYSILAPVQETL